MFDLLLTGGRVIDPAQGIDARMDVGFADGKIAAVAPSLERGSTKATQDVTGGLITPGLIDMHTHVYWGGELHLASKLIVLHLQAPSPR